ncbi:hypothetical protein ACWGS9_27770 [Bradyrhizobium sp. Arg314]
MEEKGTLSPISEGGERWLFPILDPEDLTLLTPAIDDYCQAFHFKADSEERLTEKAKSTRN